MGNPTVANVRITIGISDTTVLSDDKINLAIADSATTESTTDEIALRFHVCWSIALEWDSINGTEVLEGTKFRKPDPEKFEALYNKRIKQLNTQSGSGGPVPFTKRSTNPDFSYDTTTNEIRPREASDPYY